MANRNTPRNTEKKVGSISLDVYTKLRIHVAPIRQGNEGRYLTKKAAIKLLLRQ